MGGKDQCTYDSKKCIGEILDEFKNLYFSNKKKNIPPILIVSTALAGRAQTFKTQDNSWVLTHQYLDISTHNTVGIDIILQSLRGCGQYSKNQPILKFYSTKNLITLIELSRYNNNKLNKSIQQNYHSNDMRHIIRNTSFIIWKNMKINFTNRKYVNDLSFIHHSDFHGIDNDVNELYKYAKYLCSLNSCISVEFIANFYILPIYIYTDLISNNTQLIQQFNSPNPYRNIPHSIQRKLRQKIINYLQQNMYPKCSVNNLTTCQLSYTYSRQKILNKLYLMREKNYKSQITALEWKNKKYIPVVIYNSDYIQNPENYKNKVLIWPGTDGKYRCYVNNHIQPDLIFIQPTQK